MLKIPPEAGERGSRRPVWDRGRGKRHLSGILRKPDLSLKGKRINRFTNWRKRR